MKILEVLKGLPGTVSGFLGQDSMERFLMALLVGITLFVILRVARLFAARMLRKRNHNRSAVIAEKGIYYLGIAAIVFLVLDLAGMDVRALLGAAGIVGIAVGFAAQTSMANVISGIFLISEKAFGPGDVIRVGDTVGTVMSVDILSVKVRTFENQLVRLPNETLVKNVIVNLTRYPIRRINVELKIAHGDDLKEVRETLMAAAASVPEVLREPEPLFLADSYDDEGIKVIFGLWVKQDDIVALKNGIYAAIQSFFAEKGFRAPYSRVKLVEDGKAG